MTTIEVDARRSAGAGRDGGETMTTIEVDARRYEDCDDCLAAAEADAREQYNLAGWDLEPRWADDDRERIALTLPAHVTIETDVTMTGPAAPVPTGGGRP